MKIVSREEASLTGAKRYFTGKPCRNDHIAERYTKTARCAVCQDICYSRYISGRPGWLRDTNRKSRIRRLGISAPTRVEPEKCELCRCASTDKNGLHLDHDHLTGAFRGWLCGKCNTSIGGLGDTVEGLEQAIEYLLRARPLQNLIELAKAA